MEVSQRLGVIEPADLGHETFDKIEHAVAAIGEALEQLPRIDAGCGPALVEPTFGPRGFLGGRRIERAGAEQKLAEIGVVEPDGAAFIGEIRPAALAMDPGGDRLPHPRKIDTALIGIVITLILQFAGALWWAATMNARLDKLEADIAPARQVVETVARLDERSKAMEIATQRIERKLDGVETRR